MQIGFSRRKNQTIFTYLIRLWQGWTPYSHVFIKFFWKELDTEMVIESSHGEVHMITYENWEKTNNEIHLWLAPERFKLKMISYCVKHLQKPYSTLNLFAIVFKNRLFKDDERAFTCSELIGRALGNKIEFEDKDFILPKHIFNALTKSIYKRIK